MLHAVCISSFLIEGNLASGSCFWINAKTSTPFYFFCSSCTWLMSLGHTRRCIEEWGQCTQEAIRLNGILFFAPRWNHSRNNIYGGEALQGVFLWEHVDWVRMYVFGLSYLYKLVYDAVSCVKVIIICCVTLDCKSPNQPIRVHCPDPSCHCTLCFLMSIASYV